MGPRPRGRGIAFNCPIVDIGISASMGPRPRGRGIAGTVTVKLSPTTLQWGRDRAVAELYGVRCS